MEPKRVVITGMGIISSVGNDIPTYWKNLIDGVCGIDYVEDFKDMPVTIAGKVKDFDPELYGMDKAFIRKQDKFIIGLKNNFGTLLIGFVELDNVTLLIFLFFWLINDVFVPTIVFGFEPFFIQNFNSLSIFVGWYKSS